MHDNLEPVKEEGDKKVDLPYLLKPVEFLDELLDLDVVCVKGAFSSSNNEGISYAMIEYEIKGKERGPYFPTGEDGVELLNMIQYKSGDLKGLEGLFEDAIWIKDLKEVRIFDIETGEDINVPKKKVDDIEPLNGFFFSQEMLDSELVYKKVYNRLDEINLDEMWDINGGVNKPYSDMDAEEKSVLDGIVNIIQENYFGNIVRCFDVDELNLESNGFGVLFYRSFEDPSKIMEVVVDEYRKEDDGIVITKGTLIELVYDIADNGYGAVFGNEVDVIGKGEELPLSNSTFKEGGIFRPIYY